MAQNKEKPIDRVKKYIVENNLTQGKLVNGSIIGKFAQQFISIHDAGFDIFTINGETINLDSSYRWSDFTAAQVDKLALSSRIYLSGDQSVGISIPNLDDALPYLKNVSYVKRKWYRKILGFRSGKKWKMIVAGIGYLAILGLLFGLFSPRQDEAKPVATDNSSSTSPTSYNSSAPPKKESVEDKMKAALQANDAFQKTNSFNHKSSIISFNYNKDNGFVFARIYGQDNLSTSMIRDGMWMDTTAVLKHVKGIKEVKEIALNITFPLEDKYGKKTDETVMKVDFKRATINKIDFNNFLSKNIPTVADEYHQSPTFNN